MTTQEGPFAKKRANRRIPFFADAEITLLDGTSLRAQLAELSVDGCYLGSLVPIPVENRISSPNFGRHNNVRITRQSDLCAFL